MHREKITLHHQDRRHRQQHNTSPLGPYGKANPLASYLLSFFRLHHLRHHRRFVVCAKLFINVSVFRSTLPADHKIENSVWKRLKFLFKFYVCCEKNLILIWLKQSEFKNLNLNPFQTCPPAMVSYGSPPSEPLVPLPPSSRSPQENRCRCWKAGCLPCLPYTARTHTHTHTPRQRAECVVISSFYLFHPWRIPPRPPLGWFGFFLKPLHLILEARELHFTLEGGNTRWRQIKKKYFYFFLNEILSYTEVNLEAT